MIVWREKFVATGIHFLVTLGLAACAAALIFLVWFPDPFQTMIGGTELFVLVVGCDLALGPLISLVIYNSRKSRRELITDYSVVGAVQIAALVYGIFILAGTRPVYLAFSADRLEVVTARDITGKELAAAHDPAYATLSYTGPRLVGIEVPESERNDALFQAVSGNEVHMRPRFFVKYEANLAKIREKAKTPDDLAARKPASKPLLDAALRDVASRTPAIPAERIRWLPVHHRKGFWTALIDIDDGKPVAYFDFDPY
jgi:hypothetical protein